MRCRLLVILFAIPLSLAATPTSDAIAHSPDEVFAQMRQSFQPAKSKGAHLRYQFHFGDPQGGNWWVEVDDGACKIGKGEVGNPDVTFQCTGADWVQLSNGTLSGFRAYLTGRLHVHGSQALARKLDEMFP